MKMLEILATVVISVEVMRVFFLGLESDQNFASVSGGLLNPGQDPSSARSKDMA